MKINIWVVCFVKPDGLDILSKQLLCKASSLIKEDDVTVSAICIGNYTKSILQLLSVYGADEVIYCKKDCVDYGQITSILEEILQEEKKKPELIMFPATEWGRCIASDLAVRVDAGLTAECINIEAVKHRDKYNFLFTRAAINSTALAQIQCINTQIGMCTCQKNVFITLNKFSPKNIPIRAWKSKIDIQSFQLKILKSEYISSDEKNFALENSKLVFGIGRGVRGEKDFELVAHVAKKYNAAIAGTRAIVEEGVLNVKWQVGQSGISISPEIYVAIGISGATQHIVGIKNAKTIIALNTDERAPIFSFSNYCIVDDFKNIFKELV